MEELNILMLGWKNPKAPSGEPEAWQQVARSLASQVKLHVVLPRYDAPVSLENVTVTGLDTAQLPARGQAQAELYPFAPAPPFPSPAIPLYGTPVYTGRETAHPGRHLPGEAMPAGTLNQALEAAGSHSTAAAAPPAGLHAQVIAYARQVSRFVQGQHFDGIYALDWQTYLAAMELKLITGKKMVLQVQALSQFTHLPDRLTWMLQLEKQAFGKAEALLLDDDGLADDLRKAYGFAAAKLSVGCRSEQALEAVHQVFGKRRAPHLERAGPAAWAQA